MRGLGLLMGVELVLDRATRAPAVDEAEAVLCECLSRGLSRKTTMGNVIHLSAPLIVTRDELGLALASRTTALRPWSKRRAEARSGSEVQILRDLRRSRSPARLPSIDTADALYRF
ncbi:MAG TPA: hypothetical protein VIK06_08480 [Candidatus Limnocylindrales bacterium]